MGNRLPPADVVQGYADVLDLVPRSLTSLHRQVANELEEQDARYSSAIGAEQSSAGTLVPGLGLRPRRMVVGNGPAPLSSLQSSSLPQRRPR